MKQLPLIIASLMLSAPALAGESRDGNAGQDSKISHYCENLENEERVQFGEGKRKRCPEGYSGFRNVTKAFVTPT